VKYHVWKYFALKFSPLERTRRPFH